MKAFTTLTATAAPLFRPNINTDIITPMQYLIGTPRETMGSILFAPWRFNEDGTENSDFVLNNEPGSFATEFPQEHGPSARAMAFRVRDAAVAYDQAL